MQPVVAASFFSIHSNGFDLRIVIDNVAGGLANGWPRCKLGDGDWIVDNVNCRTSLVAPAYVTWHKRLK
jgi:hypothetical protein